MSKAISLHISLALTLALAGVLTMAASAQAIVDSGSGSGYGGDDVHCSMHTNPGVADDGATTLIWWSSANVTEANLEGVGAVDPKGWWWTNGIAETTTYTLKVTTDNGSMAYCDATVTVEGEEEEEEDFEHGYCKDVYPGRDIADIDNNGWGDTESGEEGCRIAPEGEEEEESVDHGYCKDIYPGRDIADIDNNGWGDTQSGEEGCRIAPEGDTEEGSEEESEESEEATHGYCKDVYPDRVFEDLNNDGWGDTSSDEAGCKLHSEEEVDEDEVEDEDEQEEEATTLSCEIVANPSTINAGGATTLEWVGSDSAVSGYLAPTGSDSAFATVDANGSWYIAGITNARSYSLTVMDEDGNKATCDAPIAIEELPQSA